MISIINQIKNRQSGFTIVELLVVIVVIGILASITIVAYNGVTNRANEAANKATADSMRNAALVVQANSTTGAFPSTTGTILTNLNASDAKVTLPTGASISATGAPTTNLTFTYRLKSTTGFCVGYWNPVTSSANYLFGGDATADNGTTCS